MVSNANYLMIIFINFHENLKNGKKMFLKSIIELILGLNCRCDTYFIEPVISYDELIDDLVLYENYLICIFMTINKTVKDEEKTREKLYPLQGIG